MEPSVDDWARFRHHAARVFKLKLRWLNEEDEAFSNISYSVYESLRMWFPAPHLLPNLRELECYDETYRHADIFIVPTLRILSIDYEYPPAQLFDAIARYSPNIRELRVLDGDFDADNTEAASAAVCTLKQLTCLKLPCPMPDDTIQYLASLPCFRNLTLSLDHTGHHDALSATTAAFLPLQKLNVVNTTSITNISSFLSSITPRLLVDLEVHCHPEDLQHESSFTKLFTVISTFKSLKRLIIDAESSFLGVRSSLLSGFALSLLYTIRGLLEIKLIDIHPKLIRSDFNAMAAAWPDIRHISFFSCYHAQVHQASLADVVFLARHLPKLVRLEIQIYTDLQALRDVDIEPYESCLRAIELGKSTYSATTCGEVVGLLSRIFPRARITALDI